MVQSLPPLHWLRAFEAAARHMSFTEAARELAVTQSAVSQQVRLLEHRLGRPLFHRGARSVALTDAGRAYLPSVRQAFETLAHGTEETFGTGRGPGLTVRATTGFAALWLVPRLARFRRRRPDIGLSLVSSLWHEARGAEGIDLEIRYGHGDWPDMQGEPLTQERLFPVCTPSLAPSLARPADLAGQTLIHTVGFETGWSQWLRAARQGDAAPAAGRLTCDNSVIALDLAARGLGVALTRSSYAGEAISRGTLVKPFDLAIPAEGFHLLHPRRRAMSPEAEAFRTWLLDEAGAARHV